MNTTWMSNIMKGQRVASTSPVQKKGCSTAKFSSVAKVSCWKGCEPKPGTPKTKKSPTRPGVRVNNCDCS